MTDRAHSLTVVLDHNVREDDLDAWIAAIGMMRGVLSVRANISDSMQFVAEQRARAELTEKLWKVLDEEK